MIMKMTTTIKSHLVEFKPNVLDRHELSSSGEEKEEKRTKEK